MIKLTIQCSKKFKTLLSQTMDTQRKKITNDNDYDQYAVRIYREVVTMATSTANISS